MRKVILCFIAIGAALLFVYWPVLEATPVLRYDDQSLIEPLKQTHSLSSYLDQRKNNEILDVQPVRDLSYVVDRVISEAVGYDIGHLTNLCLWFLILLLIYRILVSIEIPTNIALVATSFYAFHPIFVSSVAWLSARKHLLSAFFILSATLMLLSEIRKPIFSPRYRVILSAAVLYALACFSHPINILWPISAVIILFAYRGIKNIPGKKAMFATTLFGGVALICAYLNKRYYENDYVTASGFDKYINSSQDTVYARILALGKYMFQSILPIDYSPWGYIPEVVHSILGITLFASCAVIAAKLKERKSYPWFAFFPIALAPVIINMTNIFASDTYLITAGAAMAAILSLIASNLLKDQKTSFQRTVSALLGLLLILLISVSSSFASSWVSDLELAKVEYERQDTARNGAKYAGQLLASGYPNQSMLLSLELIKTGKTDPQIDAILSQSVYLNPSIETNEKIKMLEQHENVWSIYYKAALFAGLGRSPEACATIEKLLKYSKELADVRSNFEVITAEAYYFCHTGNDEQQAIALVKHLREHSPKTWSDLKYRSRVIELLGKDFPIPN